MKTQLHIIFLLLFIFNEVESQNIKAEISQNTPLKEHFDSNDYNGGIQNWSIDQNNEGIIYIANNDGLLEFDGGEWNTYSVPSAGRLRAVKADSQNRIFVGGQGQIGYFTKTDTEFVFTSLLNKLPQENQSISETWKILEIGNIIYFNTESKLLKFENDKLTSLNLPGYLRYAFNVNNKLFTQFYNKGLYKIVNNEFVQISGTVDISDDIVSILPKANGYLCFTRSGQVYELKNAAFTKVTTPIKLGTVNTALKLQSGAIAIGTQNDGLYIFNKDFSFKQHLTKSQGLSDRTVTSLFEDKFHNLWVALNNGIDYLKISLPFSLINEEVEIEGAGYAAIKFNNQIYLGTNNGAFTQKKANDTSFNNPFKLIPKSEGQVYNFSEVENQLILNHHQGAFKLKGDKIHKIYNLGSWKFMNTSNPNLILGGNYRGISFFKKENSKWTYKHNIINFDESSRIMEFENDSTLWMTHGSKGAYKLTLDNSMYVKGKIEHYGKDDGFPSDRLISVYSLNGKLVFTSEEGIYDFNIDSNSFTPNLNLNKWLGTDHVSKIISDEKNTLYYIQNQKLGKLHQKSFGSFENEINIFKHINKYINDDLPNISIIDNNNIFIGAKEGFIQYNPNKKFSINKDFQVLIRTVEIESPTDSIISYNPSHIDKIELTEKHSIKVQYAAPYFDGFEDLKYSYRLSPLNEQWSTWSNKVEKEFTHLPFGEYTFEVKAQNIYGLESNVSTFSFEVMTPWYFTKWAKMGYLVFGLISLTLIPLIQRKSYKKEKLIIYKNKAQALKIKDEEIHKLEHEKLKTEIDLKNDQLTTITMHLMKNNDFILDVQNKIATSINHTDSKKELKKIIKNIDKELSNNDSWDQFAYHFDQVHGNYLKKLSDNNIKLSPREIKLAAFLRMNMSSKEISKMFNITSRGVELARYRLRKKLKLERDQNLVEYLIELDNE